MNATFRIAALVTCGFALGASASLTLAQDRTRSEAQTQTREQDRIYGSQMMTEQERNTYRERMQSMRTAEERERFRLEHHRAMQDRARARGIQLPDDPPAVPGRGMGPGGGVGPGGSTGPGPGGGMGGGGGGGRGR